MDKFIGTVQEYIVWRVSEQQLDWFILQAGKYVPLSPDETGVIRSRIFLGLNLKVTALLAGDLTQVLAELQLGIDSEAHQRFVSQLAQQRSRFQNS